MDVQLGRKSLLNYCFYYSVCLARSSAVQYNPTQLVALSAKIGGPMARVGEFMAKGINQLSATAVKNKRPGKHMDGGGLHLEVTASNNRKWRFRFTQNSKRREIQIGSYPAVSLEQARATRKKNHKRLAKGLTPVSFSEWEHQKAEKKAKKKAKKTSQLTFTQCAAQYVRACLLYTSPSPRDATLSRMPSSA